MAEDLAIPCPACGGHLAFHLAGNLKIGVCDACGGAWFGSGQLDSMVKHGQAALDELVGLEPAGPHTQHAEGAAKCPLCNIPLQATTYPGATPVHASACYQCGGIFLDEDSIKALDAAAQQRTGGGGFGHQGGFGTRPPVPMPQGQPGQILLPPQGPSGPPAPQIPYNQGPPAPPVPQAPYGSYPMPPQVNAISSSLYGRSQYYQDPYQGGMNRMVGTAIVADVAMNLLGFFF